MLLASGEKRAAVTKLRRFGVECVQAEGWPALSSKVESMGINSPHLRLSPFLNFHKFLLFHKQLEKGLQVEGAHLKPWMAFLFCPEKTGEQEEGRASGTPKPYSRPREGSSTPLNSVLVAKGRGERRGAERLRTTVLCTVSCSHWQRSVEFRCLSLSELIRHNRGGCAR